MNNAIKAFKEAILLSEKFEPDSLCPSLGNLATVYNQTNDFEKAIEILNKGISIAVSTGNKQSEGSMLTSFGVAYFQKGEYDKAVDFVKKSIVVTRQIGDKRGECMSLHNLSNFSLQFEDYKKCLEYSKTGLTIAKELGLKPSEASAYYNIGTCHFFRGEQDFAIKHLKKAIDIYLVIFGPNHSHTKSARNTLNRAINYPESNKMDKMNFK